MARKSIVEAFRRRRANEDGLTLTELLVTMVVGVVLLGLVGSIFLMILGHQRQVVDTSATSAQAQSAFRGIQGTVRNAGTDQSIRISNGGNLLVANTRGVGSTSICEAWYFVPGADTGDSGTIWFQRVASGPVSAPVSGNFDGWLLFVDHAHRVDWESTDAAPVFSFDSSVTNESLVKIQFVASREERGGEVGEVLMDRTIAKLPQNFGGIGTC